MTASATVPAAPVVARAVPGRHGLVLLAAAAFLVLAAAGYLFPRWLTFLLTMAAGNGLVSLGIVALMRGGVVPFGQGMVFAAGGYAAALVYNKLGFTDAVGLALFGGMAAVLVAAPFAPLLSRYRGIFFAKLTLAVSMVTYSLLMKHDALVVLSLGHIEPNFSFWTTSGEFVFVAILAGWQSVAAVFIASTVLEIVRSFSSAYFPNTWQLALGVFLLFVIRFLPRGIGSLWTKRRGH